jgi:hypothetical protein
VSLEASMAAIRASLALFAARGRRGLCGNREEHDPHLHRSASLSEFWCTADQSQREPGRSERLRMNR